jgi:hypothetical protein
MVSTELGIQIDLSQHVSNAHSLISESRDPDSNLKTPSLVQYEKQDSNKITTDDGIQIDFSDEHSANAYFSIRESFEPDSNVKL